VGTNAMRALQTSLFSVFVGTWYGFESRMLHRAVFPLGKGNAALLLCLLEIPEKSTFLDWYNEVQQIAKVLLKSVRKRKKVD